MAADFVWSQFAVAAAAAVMAGLVRGFTGFGPAMVFTPVASAIYGPAVAVPILFLMDALVSVPVVARSVRQCHWREVLPISAGAALTIPFGVRMLVQTDPALFRWALCLAILLAAAALASGWRYRRTPSLPVTLGAGGLSGFGGGFAGLYGPPIILFWLGGRSDAATVRANIFVYFALVTFVAGASYWYSELFSQDVLRLALFLLPVYAGAFWLGTRFFHPSREALYRWLALTLCALAALAGIPLWG